MDNKPKQRPEDCNCSRWFVDGQHQDWCKHALAGGFTFGVSIDIDGKRYRLTGRYPSPAYASVTELVNAAVDFFNVHLGTSYVAIDEVAVVEHKCGDCGEQLQIVRPGKYQCVSCEVSDVVQAEGF